MIYASIKLTLKSLIKEPTSIMMYLLFPIGLVLIMSLMQSDLYAHEVKNLDIPVAIVDEDKTRMSETVVYALQSESLHGVLQLDDNPDFTITIPKGYQKAIQDATPLDMKITGIADASSYEGEVIKSVISAFNLQLQNHELVNAAMADRSLTQEEMLALQSALAESQASPSVTQEKFTPKVSLTAKETYSTTYLQMVFLVFITSYAVSNKQLAETTDLGARIRSMPQSDFIIQMGDFISGFLTVSLLAGLYIFLMRVLGWGFPGAILPYVVSVLLASLFVSGVAMLFSTICPPKVTTLATTGLMMFMMWFGDMVGPAAVMYKGTPLEVIGKLDISRILIGPFMDNNLGNFEYSSLTLFAVGTVVTVLATYIIERVKKGVLA